MCAEVFRGAHRERGAVEGRMHPGDERGLARCETGLHRYVVEQEQEPRDAGLAQQAPDKVAVVVDPSGGATASTTTFGELNAQVNQLAHGLLAAGARSEERLVWCGPNSLEVITTIHAARKCNLVAVPLSYRFNADEMQYVIDNSDATVVVVDAEQAPLVASVRDRLPKLRAVVVFGGDVPVGSGFLAWRDVAEGQPEREPDVAATRDAGAAMIYTSDTNGKPK